MAAAKKRTRTGQVKHPTTTEAPVTDPTPPCAQPPLPSSSTPDVPNTTSPARPKQTGAAANRPALPPPSIKQAPPKPKTKYNHHHSYQKHQKLPRLPSNAQITKRPLLHPPLPTPFSSASNPKIIYITASTPFVPALRRIHKLLREIDQRAQQARQTKRIHHQPNNARLASGDVETRIVHGVGAAAAAGRKGKKEGGGGGGGGGGGEKVFLKATGRAIPRALGLGVEMQGDEGGYVVRVDMGNVRAVDDVELKAGGGEAIDDRDDEGHVPETRMRTVSSVTVSIGFK
ncbi:hypothetical protein ACEQ8H_003713 [Pleosporales sp. CAS-2024a]